jgi:polyhydroxybutyrate depolymerase
MRASRVAAPVALLLLAGAIVWVRAAGPDSPTMPASDIADRRARTNGCDQPPPVPPGRSGARTITSGGRSRTYLLHVPRAYATGTMVPVVLVFHGGASRPVLPTIEQDMERWTGFSRLADRAGFIAVYPRSTTAHGLTRWGTGARQDPTVDDIRYVSDLLDHLQATLCADPQRVYAAGFSSGGGMTGVLACRMAGRIAAFAAVSGFFVRGSPDCDPARPAPILEVHGTNDKVPYDGDPHGFDPLPPIRQWLADWAGRNRCRSGPTVFLTRADVTGERWTRCAGSSTVVHYRIHGGTHAWPGTRDATRTIDATTLIWDFFNRTR